MSPTTRSPDRISIRMYQVGFGDSFLLSFGYPQALGDGRDERHLLIDFGSARWPRNRSERYVQIAADIADRTGGHLDVLVVTHRHKDHLAGFGAVRAAATLRDLAPDLVVRPWTENPVLPSDAPGPVSVDARSRQFAANLAQAEGFAAAVVQGIDPRTRGYRGTLRALAAVQVPNKAAIATLDAFAGSASKGARYVFAGQASGIEQVIPGVRAKVLGPPTPRQWPAITGQRRDDVEYWIAWNGFLESMGLKPRAKGGRGVARPRHPVVEPGPMRWLVDRMHEQDTHSLLRLVRTLDDAMNNTSVILLLTVGERRLLFPGDAQIESWSYSLRGRPAAALKADLATVDLYKVGHHGSRNASPRSLVRMWQDRERHVTSLMSTLSGVHGKQEETAVPRGTLVGALKDLGTLVRTDKLPDTALYGDVTVAAHGPAELTLSPQAQHAARVGDAERAGADD